ncbi:MAG: D,D-heptose 1,7-bisphosphate phosphatase [Candidatus Roizmanbacteria bacterium GW2011_GWA2_36_23]|uniref:D,D-heptose 1,7-bisphosphate phosphatase n=1 Tax=Candidatus Roizmanbacteria bacterium GW2011_GWA2_36_23 TaxID=1618480 RepID=A0A0G0EKW6_9BACT|nr:MAG: D,D-heptose 1,7-bisphosphate phosphatase [Candidatus Roizmanbacteria bacterium GW2011_GWA2_36_23]
MKKAIFLDKDGVLIEDIPYNIDVARIKLSPGISDKLLNLQKAGYLLIIITNQSGIAKGLFDEEKLIPVRKKIEQLLSGNGIKLDGFYYCPHDMNGKIKKYSIKCSCHKPEPGMLMQAAKDFEIDLKKSWMIGDKTSDIETGKNAGCRTIYVSAKNRILPSTEIQVATYSARSVRIGLEFIMNHS